MSILIVFNIGLHYLCSLNPRFSRPLILQKNKMKSQEVFFGTSMSLLCKQIMLWPNLLFAISVCRMLLHDRRIQLDLFLTPIYYCKSTGAILKQEGQPCTCWDLLGESWSLFAWQLQPHGCLHMHPGEHRTPSICIQDRAPNKTECMNS